MDKGEYKIPRFGSAVLIEKDGKYLLGKRNKQNYLNFWVIPGGKVEWGETLEQAGIREIKEETGLDVEIIKLICWKEIINVKDDYHRIVFFHFGKLKHNDYAIRPTDDISDVKFFTIDELKKLEPLAESAKYVFNLIGLW